MASVGGVTDLTIGDLRGDWRTPVSDGVGGVPPERRGPGAGVSSLAWRWVGALLGLPARRLPTSGLLSELRIGRAVTSLSI